MKRLIAKLRLWLIRVLGGVDRKAAEDRLEAVAGVYAERLGAKNKYIESLEAREGRWSKAVQEICRKSDTTYYDWCCEYCWTTCAGRHGWCPYFEPGGVR